jgi:hypothetical protein
MNTLFDQRLTPSTPRAGPGRIDGIRRGNIGTADIELDAAPSLASLSAMAQYLSDMMIRLDEGSVTERG